jgi:4'-phosphopantetheinyl transferase
MELADDTVHVWLTRRAAIPVSALAGYRSLMSRTERERNLRFKSGTLRDANTITRALLRTVLSHYDNYPPQRWEFAAQDHGRPYIASPASDLHFNLSHSNEWIACAVTRTPIIGVDIERCTRAVDVLRLAKRFFSEQEYRALQRCSAEDREQRFFDYWTLKEAYIKARGEGISLGLDKFSFSCTNAGSIAIECDEQLRDNPVAWHFRLSGRDADHRLALAVKPCRPTPLIVIQHFFTIPQISVENYAGPMRLRAPGQVP